MTGLGDLLTRELELLEELLPRAQPREDDVHVHVRTQARQRDHLLGQIQDPDRLAARHKKRTMANILFLDGHAVSTDVRGLPGEMGDNPAGPSLPVIYDPVQLKKHPEFLWSVGQEP